MTAAPELPSRKNAGWGRWTMVVSELIGAPPGVVWAVFTDLPGRVHWLSEVDSVEVIVVDTTRTRWRESRRVRDARSLEPVVEHLLLTVVEPGRRCTVALAGDRMSHQLGYEFTPIELGSHRGSTLVTVGVTENRPRGLSDRLLSFVVGGFAASTVEGAVRDELAALNRACLARAQIGPAAA